ncbi:MAG: TRAP transporter small permease [Deltaproteobacteria bacterium]|nr:MAG: TRAP transporter small permease [Deltaproteobacteria bacterium]
MARPEYGFAELLTTALEYLSMACVTLMAILVVAQVVLRYVFNDPLTWSEEMARIVFIYLAFLGIGAAYGRRRHMSIDALVILLPARMKKAVQFAVVGIASAFLLAVIMITARSMVELHRMDITTPALEYPMALVYLVIPLGMSALIAQMWLDLYKEGRS